MRWERRDDLLVGPERALATHVDDRRGPEPIRPDQVETNHRVGCAGTLCFEPKPSPRGCEGTCSRVSREIGFRHLERDTSRRRTGRGVGSVIAPCG